MTELRTTSSGASTMLDQLWQSYLNFAWMLMLIFSLIVLVLSMIIARHIAFGKGILCIRVGSFIILEMELIEGEELKKLKLLEKRQKRN
jgi:hypothetical protein